MADSKPKVEVHEGNDNPEPVKAAKDEPADVSRSAYVEGLNTELAYLNRQPKPNQARVAAVQAELDRFSDAPKTRRREKA